MHMFQLVSSCPEQLVHVLGACYSYVSLSIDQGHGGRKKDGRSLEQGTTEDEKRGKRWGTLSGKGEREEGPEMAGLAPEENCNLQAPVANNI